MKKIIIIVVVIGALLAIGITGCKQDITLTIPSTGAVDTGKVSFSKQLVPIFTSKCALGGCHVSGGQKPDLTSENAYKSILSLDLVDTSAATSSIIYRRLVGTLSPAMPMNGAANPSNIDGLMLAWIKQGAKNN